MKEIPRFTINLTLVAILSSASLAWINNITHPRIMQSREETLNNALNEVLPAAENGVIEPVLEEDRVAYYRGFQDTTKQIPVGYAFLVHSQGYSSVIQTLVGVDQNGHIINIKVLFQQETPGLGTKCEEIRKGENAPWWQRQFRGLGSSDLLVDKDGGRIESITGATITSRAITDAIAREMQNLNLNPNQAQ